MCAANWRNNLVSIEWTARMPRQTRLIHSYKSNFKSLIPEFHRFSTHVVMSYTVLLPFSTG